MTMIAYYSAVALPAIVILGFGTIAVLLARRKSAQVRQFICGATLSSLLLIGLVPFLPKASRPVLPTPVARAMPLLPSSPVTETQISAAGNSEPKASLSPTSSRPLDLSSVLALLAVAIPSLLALRLAGSLWAVARLRKRARPASSRIRQLAEENVRVVESLSSPVALGGFKPIILLPAEADHWPEDRLRAVLIHEQAHLRNGDPNWQVLAEIACLLHWFNPLVWFVRNAMRREAERAADDAVLQAGIMASDYATELVAFAARMGADRPPVAWTAFARKSGVNGRVRAILTPHLERNSMTKKTKITAIIAVSLAAYTVSAFTFQERSSIPTSPYADVREGKTISASPRNGYVGQLADGRKVEIFQVSRRMPDGEIVAWKPDGSLMPKSEQVEYSYRHPLSRLDTHTRYIFGRFPEAPGGESEYAMAGFGSSGLPPSIPSMLVFAGGGIIRREGGMVTFVGYIGSPNEDMDSVPLNLGVYDGPFLDGGLAQNSKMVRQLVLTEIAKPEKTDTPALTWAAKRSGPFTKVEYKMANGKDLGVDFRLVALPRIGDPEQVEQGNYGQYVNDPDTKEQVLAQRRYYARPKNSIQELRLETRKSHHVEVEGIALKPKRI